MKQLILLILLAVLPLRTLAGTTNIITFCDILDTNKFQANAVFELGCLVRVQNRHLVYMTQVVSARTADVSIVASPLLWCDTSTTNVNLHGFQGGLDGQQLQVVKVNTAHNMVVKHNGAAGTQKILTPDGSDITFTNYGSVNLVFYAATTNWYVTSYDK